MEIPVIIRNLYKACFLFFIGDIMLWFVRKFEFDLPRKAIRAGSVFPGGPNTFIYEVDNFRIIIDGASAWGKLVSVYEGGNLVLRYWRSGDDVSVYVNELKEGDESEF